MRLIDACKLQNEYKNRHDGKRLLLIDVAPTVDAVPVVRGKWVLENEPNGKPYCFHCSVCDGDFHYIGITIKYDFCPNCGADMREETGLC